MDSNAGLTLNVVVPAYHEEENVWPLTEALEASLQDKELLNRLGPFRDRITFVDNCSRDQTWNRVQQLAEELGNPGPCRWGH
jgi:hypothetical protein